MEKKITMKPRASFTELESRTSGLACLSKHMYEERTDLLEVEAVGDVVSSHEGSQQMGDGTGLAAVRPERERVHAPLSTRREINKY